MISKTANNLVGLSKVYSIRRRNLAMAASSTSSPSYSRNTQDRNVKFGLRFSRSRRQGLGIQLCRDRRPGLSLKSQGEHEKNSTDQGSFVGVLKSGFAPESRSPTMCVQTGAFTGSCLREASRLP